MTYWKCLVPESVYHFPVVAKEYFMYHNLPLNSTRRTKKFALIDITVLNSTLEAQTGFSAATIAPLFNTCFTFRYTTKLKGVQHTNT